MIINCYTIILYGNKGILRRQKNQVIVKMKKKRMKRKKEKRTLKKSYLSLFHAI
jgi:hypothetical protein